MNISTPQYITTHHTVVGDAITYPCLRELPLLCMHISWCWWVFAVIEYFQPMITYANISTVTHKTWKFHYIYFFLIKDAPNPAIKIFPSCLAIVFAQSIEVRCQVENEDVVGTAPTGDSPNTSEWSTISLPTLGCALYQRFYRKL